MANDNKPKGKGEGSSKSSQEDSTKARAENVHDLKPKVKQEPSRSDGQKVSGKKTDEGKSAQKLKPASSGNPEGAVGQSAPHKQAHSTQQKMEKTMAQKNNAAFDNFAKEAADISREYSEACMKSSTIFMKGFEDIIGTVLSIAQASAEKQSQFMKEVMSSKTINEFAEVQNKIAQASFDDFMAGATKITEIGTKILTESAEPVNTQVTKAMKKATQAMAA